MNKEKKINPYQKKQKRRRRVSRKQWVAILSLLAVAALLGGILVAGRLGGVDEHAGHNHAAGEDCTVVTDEHGHPADFHNTTGATDEHGHSADFHKTTAVNNTNYIRRYTNQDGTYGFSIYNNKNVQLMNKNKLTYAPVTTKEGDLTLVYYKTAESGYTAGNSVYFDEKNQRVSDALHGVIGTDGTRVMYCSDDDKTIIIQDLFNKSAYYQEIALPNNGVVVTASWKKDTKAATITYHMEGMEKDSHYTIPLYE